MTTGSDRNRRARAWRWAMLVLIPALWLTARLDAQVTSHLIAAEFVHAGPDVVNVYDIATGSPRQVGPGFGSAFEAHQLAVTEDARRAYVAMHDATGNAVIGEIDIPRQMLMNTFSLGVGTDPYAVALSRQGTSLYVTDDRGNLLHVIDRDTHQALCQPIPVGDFPKAIALTPDERRAYVLNGFSQGVSVVDLVTCSNVGTIPGQGYSIVITPDGQTAYVTSAVLWPDGHWEEGLRPIDLATNTAGQPLDVGPFPCGLATSRDGTRVFVSNKGHLDEPTAIDTITVLDRQTQVMRTITLGPDVGPCEMLMTPDGRSLFVANLNGSLRASLTHINPATEMVVGTSFYDLDLLAMTPSLIVPGPSNAPLDITRDDDLDTHGFRDYVNFWHGTLRLNGRWQTFRRLSLLADTPWQYVGGTLDLHGHDAWLLGDIVGEGGFSVQGRGFLTIASHSSNTLGTWVNGSQVEVDGRHDGLITVANGGTLYGTGQVRDVNVVDGVVHPGGQHFSTGAHDPGTLHASNITMAAGTRLDISMKPLASGSGLARVDRLDVSGTSRFQGARLSLSMDSAFVPSQGAAYTILTNAAPGHRFAGLAQGDVIAPGPSASGFQISYTGGDGNDVVLTFVGAPPTISAIPAQRIRRNVDLGPLSFTIGDDLTPPAALTVTVRSSNQGLIRNGDLYIGGSGAMRTVEATLVPDAHGQATITLTVSDGLQSTNRSFVVTVP